MTQENGMPMRFELIDKKTGEVASNDLWTIDFVTGKPAYNKFFYALRQAIGATDSSDPKQELYFGNLIEFEWRGEIYIGEIIYQDFCVRVRFKYDKGIHVVTYSRPFSEFEFIKIKKLGSRYDLKMKEILERAGLWGERLNEQVR